MSVLVVALFLAWAAVCGAQDPSPGWEKDFADARLAWQILPPTVWRLPPKSAASGAVHILEDEQAGRWSIDEGAVALAGRWVVIDAAARRERLITLALAPDGADVSVSCGVWGPPLLKRDSANFPFEDRSGPTPPIEPVARLTHYFRVRATELLRAPPMADLADVAWLAVAVDDRREDPFESAVVRIDPGRGLGGRAVAMALADLSRKNLVALDSPLRDPHLGDVAAAWVDKRIKKLPSAARRELQLVYDERGLLMFKLIDREREGLVARSEISLAKLQERL